MVLSALMQDRPDASVAAWMDSKPVESLWTTAVTVFEIRFGLALLPEGRRRRQLERDFERTLAEDLENRVLPFDQPAAAASAEIAARKRAIGRQLEIRDVQIAGIARARKAMLATRNLRHFEGAGVPLVDPWSD